MGIPGNAVAICGVRYVNGKQKQPGCSILMATASSLLGADPEERCAARTGSRSPILWFAHALRLYENAPDVAPVIDLVHFFATRIVFMIAASLRRP